MLETRYLTEQGVPRERGAALLRYLLHRGADELSIVVMALQETQAPFADAFEDAMAPFERAVAPRRIPGAVEGQPMPSDIRLWTLDATSLERLLGFLDEGIFHCPAGPDGWLEDLRVYRAGELLLGIVSHEREAVLRLTPQEHADVRGLGITSERSSESIRY